MRPRRLRARREHNHARGVPDGTESEMVKHGGKKRRVFEAVTAAMGADEFVLNTVKIEPYPPPEQHIEILERDRDQVRAEKSGQRIEGRLRRTTVLDPFEVSVKVESRNGHSLSTGAPAAIGRARSLARSLRLRSVARRAKKTCSKMSAMHTVMKPRLIGFWKNTVRSPRDSNSARRKFSSTSGPST